MINIKSPKEIEHLRKSGRLAAFVLKQAVEFAEAGVSTDEINTLVHDLTIKNGAVPSPLNYRGFPKSVCTSVNEVITHGIPSSYVLKDGDIVNIDVTCYLDGYHGDVSETVLIGKVDPEVVQLVEVSRTCLNKSIDVVRPGGRLGDIGEVIQDLADEYEYSVVSEYCGHGIGRNFHEDPLVFHHRTNKRGPKFEKGMVFTIEPMINIGTAKTRTLNDGWTVVTQDGSISAQFEHTLAVTGDGVEILTVCS